MADPVATMASAVPSVVLAGACRTPIGRLGGALSSLTAVELGTTVITAALERTGVQPTDVDLVVLGSVLQAGQGMNPARQASLAAGIPVATPALTLNIVCGSGLEAVNHAVEKVLTGQADVVVAGGIESMSNAPYLLPRARSGYRLGNAELVDDILRDGLTDAMAGYHMGTTAENLAERYGLSRTDLDEFSASSQAKALAAQQSGAFDAEIVSVVVPGRKGDTTVTADEAPREGTTVESLARLKPAFTDDGVVTAGNASGINDGAAAVVVLSEQKARELGVAPMATWLGSALAGVEPDIMGIGPVPAITKLLDRTGLSLDEVDLFELNEAFAAQSLAVLHDLPIDRAKVNVNGGAIALGHPIGASGCRILVTLLHALQARDADLGVASLCIGGGMGVATAVRRVR